MSESRIPREPSSPPEGFMMHEGATGLSIPIREATDEQLARHLEDANNQHIAFAKQVMELLGQATNCAKAAAVMAYEIDRRKRTIAIVGDLSQIHGLRRQ